MDGAPPPASARLPAVAADGTPRRANPLVGATVLGHYLLDGCVGVGGCGAVYSGYDLRDGRAVAVKVLHARYAERPDLAARLRRESRALARLSHPNIVAHLDEGPLEDGGLAVVLERLYGKTLQRVRQEEGALPLERLLPILAGAAAGLDEAHRAGIVHRDLKPENLFVTEGPDDLDAPTGPAKILDFGFARVAERDVGARSNFRTRDGALLGTLEFLSPEQATGRPVLPASDIYALGLVAFEALVGRLPFVERSPIALIQAHAAKPAPRLSELGDFPKAVVDAIAAALQKDPARRPATAGSFVAALGG